MVKSPRLTWLAAVMVTMKLGLIAFLIWKAIYGTNEATTWTLDNEFMFFVLVGIIAQLIDGALGTAYGAICSSLLLSRGLTPVLSSASVHTAEVFTTGVAGLSHMWLRNVDLKLFFRLAIPGVVGAALGAYLLSRVFEGDIIKPYIAGYLFLLGTFIIIKAIGRSNPFARVKPVGALGFTGGLLDAIGGGGWGSIVNTNLLRKGHLPRKAIGTASAAEFFVAFASTSVFLYFVQLDTWKVVVALIIGGVIAAPLGAVVVKIVRPKLMMFLVGAMVILLAAYNIWQSIYSAEP